MAHWNRSPRAAESSTPYRRVLVVDDEIDNAETCGSVVALMGHAVRVETSGAAAVAAVGSFEPEIVLLDISMPGMSGFGVASKIRKLPTGSGIVLVALTGHSEPLLRQRLADFQFDAHLLKPASMEELRAVLALRRPCDRHEPLQSLPVPHIMERI